jgi:hypothetical protein
MRTHIFSVPRTLQHYPFHSTECHNLFHEMSQPIWQPEYLNLCVLGIYCFSSVLITCLALSFLPAAGGMLFFPFHGMLQTIPRNVTTYQPENLNSYLFSSVLSSSSWHATEIAPNQPTDTSQAEPPLQSVSQSVVSSSVSLSISPSTRQSVCLSVSQSVQKNIRDPNPQPQTETIQKAIKEFLASIIRAA